MNPNDALKQAKEALQRAIDQKKLNQEFLNSLGPAIVDTLRPILNEVSSNSKLSKEELINAISNIKINVPKADVPQAQVDVKIPEIKVPAPQVTVNVPEIKVPEIPEIKIPTINVPKPEVTVNFDASKIKIPETKFEMPEIMKVMGEVSLAGVDKKNPLPVMMVDSKGNLMQFPVSGGGGGRGDFFTIKGFEQSAFTELMNSDGRLRVSVETGGSGLTDSELRASHLDVQQLSGAVDSVYALGAFGSTIVDGVWNADNRLRVSVETGGSGLTDAELRATAVPTSQVSGASWSTAVKEIFGSAITSDVLNADNRIRVSVETGGSGLTDSELRATAVPVSQVSGANWSVSVIDIFGSVGTNLINPDNRLKVELPTGSSGLTDTELRATAVPVSQVSGVSWSTNILNTVTVSATDLDIRDLANATDSVSAYQVSGANWSVSVTNTVPVSATDLDIRDLVNATDSVSAYQVSGHAWTTYVKEIFGSASTDVVNPDGRIKVELPTGSSGLTDTELRASSVPVAQASGAVWSTSIVSITDIFSTTSSSSVVNPDNRVKVELPSGSSGLTDTELRASAVPVSQVSGASWSTEVTNTVTVSATNLDIRDLVNATDSISAYQVSGASWSVVVNEIFGSVATDLINPDNRLKVELPTGSSGLTDTELRASSVPVEQVSGSTWSTSVVSITDIFSTTATSNVVNPDNRVKVELPTGSSGLTDTELRASSVPVAQASGATWSTAVKEIFGSTITSDVLNADNRIRVSVETGGSGLTDSELRATAVPVSQVSGANWSVYMTGATGTIAVVGSTIADEVDDGSAPHKQGGIARTANPTAVSNGDAVSFTADKIGRQVTKPLQVRDLIKTAYASLTNGTETTLISAVAGAYLDLVYLVGANNSDVAVSVDIRPVTAGNIVMTLQLPASGTAGIACPVPLPQSDTGNNWTADMGDITGTTVSLTALFSQEV